MCLSISNSVRGGIVAVTVLAALLAAPGCADMPATSTNLLVWGRVTYNGRPLPGGVVIFMPIAGNKSNWGAAAIADDGKYTVLANDSGVTGMEPGEFQIFLTPQPARRRFKKLGRFGEAAGADEVEEEVTTPFPVPERFHHPETSKLWVILEKEPTRVDIDLRD